MPLLGFPLTSPIILTEQNPLQRIPFISSFAIVMVQMCTRNPPYHEIDQLEADEIVQIIGRLVKPGKTLNLVVSELKHCKWED